MITYYISTKTERAESSVILDFCVNATIGIDTKETVASLSGFVVRPFIWLDTDNFDDFDMRSGHAAGRYHMLTENRPEICSALNINEDDLDETSKIIFCEKAMINPEHRKRKLALRLLREAMFVFGDSLSIMALKAHPDGKNINDNDCRKLANYYCSDEHLLLKEVDRSKLAGWLVGKGLGIIFNESKDAFYYNHPPYGKDQR